MDDGDTQPSYVTTFGWTDSHGQDRTLDIYAEAADRPRVWVFTATREPVAVVSPDGRVAWAAGQPAAAAVDTMAAYNDILEVCRQVQQPWTSQ
jgi:hypothetical protein